MAKKTGRCLNRRAKSYRLFPRLHSLYGNALLSFVRPHPFFPSEGRDVKINGAETASLWVWPACYYSRKNRSDTSPTFSAGRTATSGAALSPLSRPSHGSTTTGGVEHSARETGPNNRVLKYSSRVLKHRAAFSNIDPRSKILSRVLNEQ